MLPLAVIGMTYKEIARETGMGVSTVQYWVDRLTELGYIVDKADLLKAMFNTEIEDNGKRTKRGGRSSILTSKGAAYLHAIGGFIPPGSPIAAPED